MVVLRPRKSREGTDLGEHGESVSRFHRAFRLLRGLPLFLVVVKDHRRVLAAHRRNRRVMRDEKHVKKLPVRDRFRVEVHLDRLAVPVDVVVRRVGRCPSRIPDSRPENASKQPEPGVRSPESPQRERRRPASRDNAHIDRRPYGSGRFRNAGAQYGRQNRRGHHDKSLSHLPTPPLHMCRRI